MAAKIKDLTSLNFNPGEQRTFCQSQADLFGGLGDQPAADAWMMVAAMIAAGKAPPSEDFEKRVIAALRASAKSMERHADVVERECEQRTHAVAKAKGKAAGKAGETTGLN